MYDDEFIRFLKRGGRSKSAIDRIARMVTEFEAYLNTYRDGQTLDEVAAEDIHAFVSEKEKGDAKGPKLYLWAIRYYYDFISNDSIRALLSDLRQKRIKRVPFSIGKFRGVEKAHIQKLEAVGIRNANQMIEAGSSPVKREKLSKITGIPIEAILEFVKMSDLSRIGGLKAIRARLYHDAGVDTLEKLSEWDATELRAMLLEFVETTGFDGIAPLPKEARNAVKTAKDLPRMVEF